MLSTLADQVTVRSGRLRGRRREGVIEFRGVPYAAPPVGRLRFAPPATLEGWAGVRDATADGPIAPQPPSRVFAIMGEISAPQDESCLTLTIWRPERADGPLPVMVWLHGGGFSSGAGSLTWYDGHRLAGAGNVIVVNVNYRLGAFGYLCVPGLLTGNLAVLDQEAALRWVHDNIGAFGGDPGNVTVVGQSGGGHTIASFLTMPRTTGLFRRAILQSPPLGIGLHSAAEAGAAAAAFLAALGLPAEAPDLLERLRSVPVPPLLAAQGQAAQRLARMDQGDLRPPFMPSEFEPHNATATTFIDRAAVQAVARGVDVLIGWTRDEANLFYPPASPARTLDGPALAQAAARLAGLDADARLHDVRQRRPDAASGQWFLDLIGDLSFRLPARRFAARVAALGGRVFAYQFDWGSPQATLGACHCIDLPFVFGTHSAWMRAPILAGTDEASVAPLTASVMRRWSAFAATGRPVDDDGPQLQPWRDGSSPVLHLDRQSWIEAT
jgi:para-nitrobenzyl esterase